MALGTYQTVVPTAWAALLSMLSVAITRYPVSTLTPTPAPAVPALRRKANNMFSMHQDPAKKPTVATWIAIIVATLFIYLGSWPPVKAFYDAKYPTHLFPQVLKTFYGPAAWISGKPTLEQPVRAYWAWCYEMFGGKL